MCHSVVKGYPYKATILGLGVMSKTMKQKCDKMAMKHEQ